jgi:hypothetical protein
MSGLEVTALLAASLLFALVVVMLCDINRRP